MVTPISLNTARSGTIINSQPITTKSKDLKSPDLPSQEFKFILEEKINGINAENRFEIISELTEVLDLFLQDIWTDKLQIPKKEIILESLKKILGERGQGNIVLAQINPTPGDIEGNSKKAMAYIKAADAIGADCIIFPELTLMGYPIHDAVDRHPFIVDENIQWLQEIAKRTGKTKAIVGFVEPRKPESGKKARGKDYFNSLAILGDGQIQGLVRKSLLPTYSEFNDYRYFEPSPLSGVHSAETLQSASWGIEEKTQTGNLCTIHNHSYGIGICEDTWNDEDFFITTKPMYKRDPIAEIAKNKPEILINSSASPTRARKEQLKHNMLSFISQKYKVPYVYVNQVGAVDDVSFDGTSRVYNKDGKLIARAKAFSEQFLVVNPIQGGGKVYPLPQGLEQTLTETKTFNLNYENDLERTYLTIAQGIRDYFNKTGFKKAVLGLSGGLDSTICAVLLRDALGVENVLGVSMPSVITPNENKNDAKVLAENLGINFIEIPISKITESTNTELKLAFDLIGKKWEHSLDSTSSQNVQARARALLLWSISNEFKDVMPIATSDKSEIYIGYATINGDMSGGFAPIADVTKTKLFALGKWLNENREVKNVIPESVLKKKPSADLQIDPKTGTTLLAEDDNMPYEFLDEIIWRIENLHQSFNQLMNETFLYEKTNKLTKKQKEEWLEKFYRKMPYALYKWSILPPSVLVDSKSINKADYRQPIVSLRINWRGDAPEEIARKLES